MQDLAHHVSDILATIAERLQPRDFYELINYSFSDLLDPKERLW